MTPDTLEYGKACSRKFRAAHSSGTRKVTEIRLAVIHDEENKTAVAAASWFKNPESKGSAQLCIDGKECYRTLEDIQIPWGAPGANHCGVHFELAGFAKWSLAIWLLHTPMLKRGAYKVARACKTYKLPVRFLTADQLEWNAQGDYIGPKGITTHREISKAFGGDHSDPGPFFPRRRFMNFVRTFYQEA